MQLNKICSTSIILAIREDITTETIKVNIINNGKNKIYFIFPSLNTRSIPYK
jgi:hypothetical protein